MLGLAASNVARPCYTGNTDTITATAQWDRLDPERLPWGSGNYGHTTGGRVQKSGRLDAFADDYSHRRLTVHGSQNVRALPYQFDMDVSYTDRNLEYRPYPRTIRFPAAAQRYQGVGYFHIGIAPHNPQIFRSPDLFDVFSAEMDAPTNHRVAMVKPKAVYQFGRHPFHCR